MGICQTEIEWRIELIVKRYAERGGELKFGQRFRYNNLTQSYAKYKDMFRKRMAQKEEGKVERHFGAAAKAIEAERARAKAAALAKNVPANAPPPAEAPAPEARVYRMVCSEPENERDKVDQLFQAFVQARKDTGEETHKLTRAGFDEFVRKKTKELQEKKSCRDVEYVVETVDGQVKLKVLAKA